ncbi:MAG: divalent metal cation transporter [Deltaproteobacteria bacterium]|nr:divalent metal cation transporter [Deltaproteobacteria bacterium]
MSDIASEGAQPSLWRSVGPGILFAGAAVGVSHLVQSTRAGASYGLALIGFVLVANALKYPAFRFGPQYAAATGTSLLQGYRRRGKPALGLYLLVTLGTMLTVQAAVAVVTAGVFLSITGLPLSPIVATGILLAICAGLTAIGQYRWLDTVTKGAVALFTLATLVATAMALPRVSGPLWPDFGAFEKTDILFIAALVGWMPSAIDVAVWQSLWTLARGKQTGDTPTVRGAIFDFHVGYLGTVVLALCFLVLGAAVMRGATLEAQPAAFGAQLVSLYADTLGAWSKPIIGAAAFLVMFSTTLTVVDGFPRALSVLADRFRSDEVPGEGRGDGDRRVFWGAVAVLFVGSLLVLHFALRSLGDMVDLATTLSFLTAPLLSLLNHRAITGAEVPEEGRPSAGLRLASWVGIVAQTGFALYYLALRFG